MIKMPLWSLGLAILVLTPIVVGISNAITPEFPITFNYVFIFNLIVFGIISLIYLFEFIIGREFKW